MRNREVLDLIRNTVRQEQIFNANFFLPAQYNNENVSVAVVVNATSENHHDGILTTKVHFRYIGYAFQRS